MAKVNWSDVEDLVKPLFEDGNAPERSDMIDLAYAKDASDDVIDAIDSLHGKPIADLETLKSLLTANGVLE